MRMISVAVEKRLGDFSLDVRFDSASLVTAVFGPSAYPAGGVAVTV